MKIQTVIAINRFGLGARPGELTRVDGNHRQWLLRQLDGPQTTPAALSTLPNTATVLREVDDLRMLMRAARTGPDAGTDRSAVKRYGKTLRSHYLAQVNARYTNAAETDFPFYERLVLFWSNHFAVSVDKQPLPAVAGTFENEAIRPHVAGNFLDMLLAVEQHPAMLLYLDNRNSVGPNSYVGKRARNRKDTRDKGLNENLAREILELHTLGVNGGYRQADVTSFARIITGWSLGGNGNRGDPGTFLFREAVHEPGTHTVLKTRYSQEGVKQGEAVLRDLARHPATARHIARKLARHFISDTPPQALVDHLTTVYLENGGELKPVHAALVDGIEACQRVTAKYKSPQDFVISAMRALEQRPASGQWAVTALDLLGQRPYQPGSPAGWPDTEDHWGGADALYKRIEWADNLARRMRSDVNPVALGDAVLGRGFNQDSRTIISRAESVNQGMTLLLASPDFQRR